LRTYVRMEARRGGNGEETAEATAEAERGISCLFRGTFASASNAEAGVEPLLHHPGLAAAARKVSGCPIVVPRFVFANILTPGMHLMTHTDIPEFWGATRKNVPHWLLVVMHHSGLFRQWRLPITQAVCWFSRCEGGEFSFYPFGPDNPSVAITTGTNTALVFDPDTVFHRVDKVGAPDPNPPHPVVRVGMELRCDEEGRWLLFDHDKFVAKYRWDEIRLSIAFKFACFKSEDERQRWTQKKNELSMPQIIESFVSELKKRGAYHGEQPGTRAFARLICDQFYPAPVW